VSRTTAAGSTGDRDASSDDPEREATGVERSRRPLAGAVAAGGIAAVASLWLATYSVGSGTAAVGIAGGLGLAAATRLFAGDPGSDAARGAARGAVAGAVGVVGLALAALAVGLAVAAADGRLALWLAGPALVWVGLAAGLAGTDAVGGSGLSRAGGRLAPVVGGVWLAVLTLSPVTNGLATLSAGLDLGSAFVYADGIAALVVLPLLVVAAAGLARKALVDLPVVDLVPPGRERRRDALGRARDAAVRALGATGVGALLALMVGPFLVIPLFGTPTALADGVPWPAGALIGGLLLADAVRTLLVVVAALAAGALAVASARSSPADDRSLATRIAPTGGAVPTLVLLAASAAATGAVDRLAAVDAVSEFVAETPFPEAPAALALSGLATAALVGLLLLGATVLTVGGAMPRRVAGSALAATATFALAGLALLATGATAAAAAGTVAAMAVWDAGEHAVTLGAEVGRGPARRVELVHLGGTLAVGIGALLAVLALGRFVDAVAPREALPAFALALVLALGAGAAVLFVLDG